MPNGGNICCAECELADFSSSKCTLYGTPMSGMLLCRHFRIYGRSGNPHEEWPMLSKLESGVIYEIANDVYKSGDPRPRFRVKIEDAETTSEP